jgi:hypothetical protein
MDYIWKLICNKLRFNFKNEKWQFIGFDYDPEIWFIFEFDVQFKGWGSCSKKIEESKQITTFERSLLHLVFFKTKFGIRTIKKVYEEINKDELKIHDWG